MNPLKISAESIKVKLELKMKSESPKEKITIKMKAESVQTQPIELSPNDDIEEEELAVHDTYFYGELNQPVKNLNEVLEIMTRGVEKLLKNDTKMYSDVTFTSENFGDVVDRWFEHDSDHENYFDHLISGHDDEAKFEDFLQTIKSRIKEKSV
jgi:hypothetical protein